MKDKSMMDILGLKFYSESETKDKDYYQDRNGYVLKIYNYADINYKMPNPFSVHNKYAILNIKNFLQNKRPEISLVSEDYQGSNTKLEWKCGVCQHHWPALLYNIKEFKSGCPKCAAKRGAEKQKISHTQVLQKLKESNLKLVEGYYIGANSPLICMDSEDYIFMVILRFLKNIKTNKVRFLQSNPYAIQNIWLYMSRHHPKLKLMSYTFENAKIKLKVHCTECETTYPVSWDKIKNGKRCPTCMSSKVEKRAINYFKSNNIEYVHEKKFDDCYMKGQMRFDFYLPKYNLCIELDGAQHFMPIERFGGEIGYNYNLKRDNFKNNYCSKTSKVLIRIPYWRFDDLEDCLTSEINKYT